MSEVKLNIKEMRKNLYLLDEGGMSTGYLIAGEKMACLIDTMNGFTDLKKVCQSLTDKPLMVINTHCHPDHIHGNDFFDKVYIHPADEKEALFFAQTPDYQEILKARGGIFPSFDFVEDGQIIDLGGRTLKIFLLPGHTNGGILLLCPEERILFTGDSINHHLWMQLPNCTSIKTFISNLEKLLFLEKEADVILHGHAHDFDDISLMSAVCNGAKEIAEGKTEKDTPYKYFGGDALYHPFSVPEGKYFQQEDHGICYVKENI